MDDRELTQGLAALGLDRSNWRAVALLPLVEVAWADGKVQRAERELLEEIAQEYGIHPGSAFLERWLARRPPKATFLAARTMLMRLWTRAGQRQAPQPQTLDELLDLCLEVAEAAGGLFGLAFTVERSEREAIREIASSLALGPQIPRQVVHAWSEEQTRILAPPRGKRSPSLDATTERLVVPSPSLAEATTRIRPRGRWAEDDDEEPLDPADEVTKRFTDLAADPDEGTLEEES